MVQLQINQKRQIYYNPATNSSARPKERAYKLFDERGLFMLVTPTGGRLWRFRYRLNGVEKLLTFGAYPDVSLKRAPARNHQPAPSRVAQPRDPDRHRYASQL